MQKFEILNQAHKEFVQRKFPEIVNYEAALEHLKEEVDEAIESGAEEEFADMQMLLLSAFRLRFPLLNTSDLIDMCYQKLAACEKREWGEVNELGYINHIRK